MSGDRQPPFLHALTPTRRNDTFMVHPADDGGWWQEGGHDLLEPRLQAEAGADTPPDGGTPAKHRAAAIAAVQQAYEKAWLQGPPFAYAYGLANATAHLDALGVDYPDMPPYDDSLYEPMPEVDIIRLDEQAQ